MGTPVSELCLQPFSVRSLEDQQRIVQEGRPLPAFHSSEVKGPSGTLVRFEEVVYRNASWITGCPVRSAFFCWPCLLFGKKEWSIPVTDYKYGQNMYLVKYIHEHEVSSEHIESELYMKIFCTQHLKSPNVNLKTRSENERKQRDVLRRLISVVHKNVVQEANRRRSSYCGQLNVEDCVRVLQLTRNYDNYCLEQINSAIELIKQSPKIVSDIVDAMTSVVKLTIKKEIEFSTYVSLILSEHSSEIPDRSLVSTVLRYVSNGRVCERFTGFCYLSNKSSDVFKHIVNVLLEFQIADKILAYSLDGGVLPLPEFIKLSDEMKTAYPFTFYIPWHAHKLEYILQQSLSSITECKHFINFVTAMENYMSKNSKRWTAFKDFIEKKGITLNNKCFTKTQSITTVCTNRKNFVEFFDSVVKSSKKWDSDDVVKALGFRQYLQESLTVFLLEMFSRLLEITDSFRRSLQGDVPENIFNQIVVDDLKEKLANERDMGFEALWTKVTPEITDCKVLSFKAKCHKLFCYILLRVLEEISARFEEVVELEFCRIIPSNRSKNDSYIDLYLGNLKAVRGPYFETEEMRSEVTVLNEKISEFPSTSLDELYIFLLQSSVKDALPSVFRSAEFTLTLPTQRAAYGRKSSKLKDIRKWIFSSDNLAASGDLSILCVELNAFLDFSKSESFNNEVMRMFLTNLKEQLTESETDVQVKFFSEIIP